MSNFKNAKATFLFVALAVVALMVPASSVVAQGDLSITVNVREETVDGDPIPEFAVRLLGIPADGMGEAEELGTLETDENGQVTFSGLAAGTYQAVGVPYEEGRACSALPSELVEFGDAMTTGEAFVLVECGETAAWQLLLLALPAVTVGDPDTP